MEIRVEIGDGEKECGSYNGTNLLVHLGDSGCAHRISRSTSKYSYVTLVSFTLLKESFSHYRSQNLFVFSFVQGLRVIYTSHIQNAHFGQFPISVTLHCTHTNTHTHIHTITYTHTHIHTNIHAYTCLCEIAHK